MSTMVPMYGFGGGGGKGASLTVTAPAGCTVTVSKDGKTKTKIAGTDGVAVFRGLATGTWTLTISDGEQTAQKTVTVTADYSTAITFFAATIHVTYPAGSTCTATDGVTTLTAPDASGSWDCVVPNAGTWTLRITNGGLQYFDVVNIENNGQVNSITLRYNTLIADGAITSFASSLGGLMTKGMGLRPSVPYGKKPTVTTGDGYVQLYIESNVSDQYYGGLYYFSKKIDVTHLSTLKADIETTVWDSANTTVGVWSNINGYSEDNRAAYGSAVDSEKGTTVTVRKVCAVDVSGLTGEYYIGIFVLAPPPGYTPNTTKVYSMWTD